MELDAEMTVTLHVQTVDQTKAIKTVKGKISDIDKMKVEEQRKATRSGYDPDILPPDLITYAKDKDAAALLADLQSRNERMFLLTFLVVNTAPTREGWKTRCSPCPASPKSTTAPSGGWTTSRSRAICPPSPWAGTASRYSGA